MMERGLRNDIMAAVRDGVQRAMEDQQEVWIQHKDLCKQFATLTPSWLDRYGHLLPRTRPTVTDEDGNQHSTSWVYPRNKLQRMFRDGSIKML